MQGGFLYVASQLRAGPVPQHAPDMYILDLLLHAFGDERNADLHTTFRSAPQRAAVKAVILASIPLKAILPACLMVYEQLAVKQHLGIPGDRLPGAMPHSSEATAIA